MTVFERENSKHTDAPAIAIVHCGISNVEQREIISLLFSHFQGVIIELDLLQYMEHKIENVTHELLWNMSFLKERMRLVLDQLQRRYKHWILMTCGIQTTAVANLLLHSSNQGIRGLISCIQCDYTAEQVMEKLSEWEAASFQLPTLLLWDCNMKNSISHRLSLWNDSNTISKCLCYPFKTTFGVTVTPDKESQQQVFEWIEKLLILS